MSSEDKGGAKTNAKTKSFEVLAEAAGVKAATLQKLIENDFDSLPTVKLLQDPDIAALELSLGQTRIVAKWRESLNTGKKKKENEPTPPSPVTDRVTPATQPGAEAAHEPTAASLARDKDLTQLLQALGSKPGDDLWESGDRGEASDAVDLRPPGKALLIPDFVNRVGQGSFDGLEREVCTQGEAQLVLRQVRQKPLPEQVSVAQYLSANARLMAKMITDGQLKSQADILSYLEYTANIGDFAQVCEVPSVMIYDKEFRKKQARIGQKWNDDDIHLATYYLNRRRRTDVASAPSPRSSKPPRLLDRRGNEICRSYNGTGCYREVCKFSHVCSVCKENHPRSSHGPTGGHGSSIQTGTFGGPQGH